MVTRCAVRLLARQGLVVLRMPNGDFYRTHIEAGSRWICPLGYNNLLGFPYLNGYNVSSVEILLRSTNFEPIATIGATFLTPPYPDLASSLTAERAGIEKEAQQTSAEDSPWIEVVGRLKLL